MAITRAQQAKQMLQDGGMLVQPSTTGKRLGYRGDAAARASGRSKGKATDRDTTRSAPTSRSDPGERDTPGFNPTTNRFEKPDGTPEVARTPTEVQASKDAAIQQGRFDKPSFLRNFFSDYTKGSRKLMYNMIRNNPNSELAYLSKLTPSQAKGLPTARLRELYETIQDTDFSGDLSFEDALGEDFEKLSFEDYDALTRFNPDRNVSLKETLPDGSVIDRPIMTDPQGEYGALSFPEYKGRIEGSFGSLLGGNVGNIEVFKNPDGTYGYREKTGGRDETMVTTDPCKGPNPPAYCFIGGNATTNPVFTPAFRFMNRGGMVEDAPMGGIMDLESTRQMLFIGGIAKGISKGIKGITRAAKKVVKSPFGKAAILGAIGFGIPGTSFTGLLGGKGASFSLGDILKKGLLKDSTGAFSLENLSGGKIAALSGLAGLIASKQTEEDDFDIDKYYEEEGLKNYLASLGPRYRLGTFNAAKGGKAEPVAKKVMPLLDMDGKEMDLRDDGGFVPIGRMEKADDVPARLSKNEFVFTADAVRNAGDGDVDKGAEVMYNTMKNLEAGGKVSEETQGLDGAKEMFQTAQRLEGVM